MKKAVSAFAVLAIIMIILITVSFTVRSVRAQGDYTVDRVDHTVQVLYNGYILINDTVKLSISGQAPNDFLVGFPEQFGPKVVKSVAFSGSSRYPVTLNVPLDSRAGFYSARIDFPQGAPETFTVAFVLSNSVVRQNPLNTTGYTISFPGYPSLAKDASSCFVSVVLPFGFQFAGGDISAFTYSSTNLPAFTYNASSLTFLLSGNSMQLFDVSMMNRQISVDEFGDVSGSDTYFITNQGLNQLGAVDVFLPVDASTPQAEDQFGRVLPTPSQVDSTTNRYTVNFSLPINTHDSTKLVLTYDLPDTYLTRTGNDNFGLEFSFFTYQNYYINQTSVTFVIPEGARVVNLQNSLSSGDYVISRTIFQDSVTLNRQGIFSLDSFKVGIAYAYDPLWLSFRPTIWVLTLAVIGSIIGASVWRAPKGPAKISAPLATARVRPEYLKAFADAYEEKNKIMSEMESLEERVQKGRIPRRRYKVRMKILETRLGTLTETLAEYKQRTRSAGGQYADLMRQLEIAETDINEAETNMKSIEARHNRGEISLEAYRKLLSDYEHRKEDAQTTISGILLRLREEAR